MNVGCLFVTYFFTLLFYIIFFISKKNNSVGFLILCSKFSHLTLLIRTNPKFTKTFPKSSNASRTSCHSSTTSPTIFSSSSLLPISFSNSDKPSTRCNHFPKFIYTPPITILLTESNHSLTQYLSQIYLSAHWIHFCIQTEAPKSAILC